MENKSHKFFTSICGYVQLRWNWEHLFSHILRSCDQTFTALTYDVCLPKQN